MRKAIIIGATSGIGKEVALLLHKEGWQIGIAGRRLEALKEIKAIDKKNIFTQQIDVTKEQAPYKLEQLIEEMNGVDLIFLSSGVGYQNVTLNPDTELQTAETNVKGFIKIIDCAFNYFKESEGHIAVISSIAGTKGLGVAPAYSATKRFQNTYIDALEQLAHMQNYKIAFTDIKPGFVKTDLLKGDKQYPLLMDKHKVAQEIVKALKKRKRRLIIDYRYRVLVFFWRLIPSFLWKRLSVKTKKH